MICDGKKLRKTNEYSRTFPCTLRFLIQGITRWLYNSHGHICTCFYFSIKEFKINEILPNCEMSEKMQVVIRRNFTEDMNQDHLVRT